jgi:hypothetical protein
MKAKQPIGTPVATVLHWQKGCYTMSNGDFPIEESLENSLG